jgi:hypothetical protein
MVATARALLAGCLLSLITGCSTPEQKQQAEARALRSWGATLELTSEALAQRKIPPRYAKQVLQGAWEHEQTHRTSPEWQSLSLSMKREFAAAAARLAHALGEPPTSPGS